jgi:hypothetical protein
VRTVSRWNCVWEAPRPYVHPVCTPRGVTVSANAPADHPWHHALWSTIKFVNGANFWEEYGEYGILHTVDVVEDVDRGCRATIDWIGPDGVLAAREVRTIAERGVDGDADAYALDWEFAITPAVDTVFDRTPYDKVHGWGGYSGLTLRGAPDFTDTRLMLADGSGHDAVRGAPSAFCALEGPNAGVVLADHPSNDRFPTPWYASTQGATYGEGWANFVNAAFLWDAPMHIAAGETLRRRHLVVVHDGRWDVDDAAEVVHALTR